MYFKTFAVLMILSQVNDNFVQPYPIMTQVLLSTTKKIIAEFFVFLQEDTVKVLLRFNKN